MPTGTPVQRKVSVAVVGGGATGAATAFHLARAGIDVALLDRHDLNTEASGRNAGSLHGQIQHEPFEQMGEQWATDFLPALRFLADSLDLWDGLSRELGADLEVKKNGGILVADTAEQMRSIERKVALEQTAGIASRVIDRHELRELAPWVSDDAVGGEFCPIEGKANPLVVAPAFAREAEKNGAIVRTHQDVRSISRTASGFRLETADGWWEAEKVVLAAGDAMAGFGRQIGLNLPISSEAVQVSVTEPVTTLVEHLVYYAGGKLTFKQAATGALLIGGGWPARRDASGSWILDPDSLRRNIAMAIRVAPSVASVKLLRTWVGIGNGTPDQRPIVGESTSMPGLFLGIFPYMGLTAGPLMGRTLAALVQGKDPGRDLTPFDPARFS